MKFIIVVVFPLWFFIHFPLLQKPLSKPKKHKTNVYVFLYANFFNYNFFKKFAANLCPGILLVHVMMFLKVLIILQTKRGIANTTV